MSSEYYICLAFTVDDVENEYEKVLTLGAEIIEPHARRPWGAVNMSFYDPDNNMIYFRSFPKKNRQATENRTLKKAFEISLQGDGFNDDSGSD